MPDNSLNTQGLALMDNWMKVGTVAKRGGGVRGSPRDNYISGQPTRLAVLISFFFKYFKILNYLIFVSKNV